MFDISEILLSTHRIYQITLVTKVLLNNLMSHRENEEKNVTCFSVQMSGIFKRASYTSTRRSDLHTTEVPDVIF